MDRILEALRTTGLLFWMTFWAFTLGYTLSAVLQTLVTREQMSRVLGERGLRQGALATFFGFISSSCSFAALAASRTVFSKGAHVANAFSFLIASTNLVIELGIILWILIGWRFVVGDYLLGLVMVVFAYLLTRWLLSESVVEEGRRHARKLEDEELKHPSPEGKTWREKITSREGWQIIAFKYFGEWRMAVKEVFAGFVLAGFVSVFVPPRFWSAIFLGGGDPNPPFWAVVQHAVIAPVMAFFTFVGSLGNVPLAAVVWTKNMSVAGVLSFLGADLVAATVVYLHAKYYGWRFALALSGVLYLAMVAAAVAVHYVFVAFGAVPQARPAKVMEMMSFDVQTHTFWLNVVSAVLNLILLGIVWRARQKRAS